jgi:hypothetical protein
VLAQPTPSGSVYDPNSLNPFLQGSYPRIDGSNQLKKSDGELFYGEKMTDARPVRCQKCGNPLGYVTVLAKGLASFQQPIQNVKIVAICMECFQKKK